MAPGLDGAIEAALADITPEPGPEDETTEVVESSEEQPDDVLDADEVDGEDSEDDEVDPDGDSDEEEPEGDDEEADEDEDNPDDGVLTLTDEASVTLPDGTELTGKELREGYLRHADYTRKTQDVADKRREVDEQLERMETWFDERASNPDAWAWEVVSEYADDPAAALAGAIGKSANPDGVLAWTIRKLAETGRLGDEFVRLVGLEEVAGMAATAESDNRVAQLEKQVTKDREERDRTASEQAEQARRAQLIQQVQSAWGAIKAAEGLSFDSEQDDTDAMKALLTFAHQNGVGNLETAYAAMAHRGIAPTGNPDPTPPPPAKQEIDEAVERKRKTRAITRKPSGGSAAKPARRGLDDALTGAVKDLGLKL